CHNLLTVEKEIETPFEQVDELILCRMDMRRNECFGRKGRVPGKRTLAQRFRNISLAQNIPDNAFDARTGLGDTCGQRLHSFPPSPLVMPLPRLRPMQRSVVEAITAGLFTLSRLPMRNIFRITVFRRGADHDMRA